MFFDIFCLYKNKCLSVNIGRFCWVLLFQIIFILRKIDILSFFGEEDYFVFFFFLNRVRNDVCFKDRYRIDMLFFVVLSFLDKIKYVCKL